MNEQKDSVTSSDFENNLNELQKIVSRLENDSDVTLEDSMALYERGLKLTKECVDKLSLLSARIAELNGKLDLILGENDEN